MTDTLTATIAGLAEALNTIVVGPNPALTPHERTAIAEAAERLQSLADRGGEKAEPSLSDVTMAVIHSTEPIDLATRYIGGIAEALSAMFGEPAVNQLLGAFAATSAAPSAVEPVRVRELEAALRYARPLLVKYAYTQGNSADFVREITAPIDAALHQPDEGTPK